MHTPAIGNASLATAEPLLTRATPGCISPGYRALVSGLIALVLGGWWISPVAAQSCGLACINAPAATLSITGNQYIGTPFERAQPAQLTIDRAGDARLVLTPDGDVEFGDGATADFADTKPYAGLPAPFFVVIKVGGKKYVVQAFEYVE